ncbi:alkene reductase, partial [Streptomyces sp. C1-2]|nr:alkene reductase [Streptomyces sp. C1-2]
NLGFTREGGNDLLARGLADAVAFGAPFIANPDLVDRFAHGHPLAEGDPATYYAGGAEGYIDYPDHRTVSAS